MGAYTPQRHSWICEYKYTLFATPNQSLCLFIEYHYPIKLILHHLHKSIHLPYKLLNMATTVDQHVRLYYLGDSPSLETEKPYIISPGFMKSVPECNWKYAAGPVQTIKDARGREGDFSLLKQGFAFRKWTPSKINWESESDIIDKYLPEAQDFIARELNLGDGLKRCEAFDWRVGLLPSVVSSWSRVNTDNDRKLKSSGSLALPMSSQTWTRVT